ncbi:MAG: hypothetical protein KAS32_00645 [Candidatus Peribacteraceae bacterium]|nr:hypothetical protein [Candidatus Peribacteraceae bacterium]
MNPNPNFIELSNVGIRAKREKYFVVTATFIVELPEPCTFSIDVAGKTIEEGVANLISYIRDHSEVPESTLQNINKVIFGLLEDGEKLLKIKAELASTLCKAKWTGDDANRHYKNL